MDDIPLDDITSHVICDVMSDENEFNKLLADAADKARCLCSRLEGRYCCTSKGSRRGDRGFAGRSTNLFFIGFEWIKGQRKPANLTIGSTPYFTYQAIKKRPGMTGAEIVAAVQTAGHNVSEGNIRTSISRVKEKKLIVSRHGKWFPL